MSDASQNPEKKLIIDEDWKSQVEAEREAAKQTESSGQAKADAPLPPPTLAFLISTLYLQGAISLGLLPNPITQKAEVRPNQARHAIDMLAMLQEKTEGNRSPDESADLEAALHELRLAYVGANPTGN